MDTVWWGWRLQVAGFRGSPAESSGPMIRNTVPRRIQANWQFRWHPLLGSVLLKVCFTDSWASWDPFGVSECEDYSETNTKTLSAFSHCTGICTDVRYKTMVSKLLESTCESGPWHQTASSSHDTLHCQVLAVQRKERVSLKDVPWEAVKMTICIKS